MARKEGSKILNFVVWLTGVIVSLAVGFALINGGIAVPYIGIANVIAGYVVVVTIVLGVVLALLKI